MIAVIALAVINGSNCTHLRKLHAKDQTFQQVTFLVLEHIPRHAHKCVHDTFWATYLQGGLHAFLHLHVTSWGNALEITSVRIHVGFQFVPHFSHP